MNKPHDGHKKRLRDRFNQTGLSAFYPHEIAELLLSFARSRQDTNAAGHALIARFQTLRGVLDADYASLTSVPGVGEQSATLIRLAGAIAREYESSKFQGGRRLAPEHFESYAAGQLGKFLTERILVVCLDGRGAVLRSETVAKGTASEVSVRRRDIMRLATESEAVTGVIVAHNHPDGDLRPSQRDAAEAARLKKTLSDVGIRLLDFIIVGGSGAAYSLERSGLLPP